MSYGYETNKIESGKKSGFVVYYGQYPFLPQGIMIKITGIDTGN